MRVNLLCKNIGQVSPPLRVVPLDLRLLAFLVVLGMVKLVRLIV